MHGSHVTTGITCTNPVTTCINLCRAIRDKRTEPVSVLMCKNTHLGLRAKNYWKGPFRPEYLRSILGVKIPFIHADQTCTDSVNLTVMDDTCLTG